MPHLRTRLVFIASAIAVTVLGGTLGFALIEKCSWFDAFYFTLTTVTTVGYGELFPLSRIGRIFNSFLIFFGVTTMLLAIGGMTQTVIELELNQFFGRRRVKNMIDKLNNHYIVCGYGRVGRGSAAELRRANVPFVVIDRSDAKVESAVRAGLLAVSADANRDETLLAAGILRARGLIATLSTDADNLFLLLSAKALNPRLPVSTRISDQQSEQKFQRAGADFVFAPYDHTGIRMAQSLLKPHVFQFIDYTTTSMGLNVGIEQVRVSATSSLGSQSLAQMRLRSEMGVIVLAIKKADGRMIFNPPADAVIEGGDYLVVMGEPGDLRKLEQILAEVRA